MFLFRTFVLRFLAREPLRTALTVLGVALGVALVVAIRLANGSSLRGFETALETMSGKASIEVVGSGLGIDETRLADLGWLRSYGAVSPVIEGEALAFGETVRVLGVDMLRDQPLREYALLTGPSRGAAGPPGAEAPPPTAREILDLLLDPQSSILTEKFARRHGVTVGSTLPLRVGDREVGFRVRALLRDEGPARVMDGNFVLLDIATAQWALDRLGRVDRLDIRLRDAASIDRAEADIAQKLPEGLTAQRPARRGRQVERMLSAFHLNLTALSAIGLLVGLFLVYNTIATSVVVRREEIGTLRALGVDRRRVLALFLAEAAVLASAGTLVGIVLGRLLAVGAVGLMATTVRTLYIANASAPPALTAGDVGIAIAVGVPLSLLAALLPASEAARVSPLVAIRGSDRLASRFALRGRQFVWPGLLLAGGGWLATLPPLDGVPVAGYASAIAFVFGAAFAVPLVLFALARLGRRVLGRWFGVEGLLAHGNLAGAIPRLSVAVAALAVSLSMMVAIAIMIGSFRETVVYWIGQTLQADLFIGPSTRGAGARQSTISSDVEAAVRAHPAVAAVDAFRSVTVPYGGTFVSLLATDFGVLVEKGNLAIKEPQGDGVAGLGRWSAPGAREAIRAASGTDAVIVSEAFANKHGVGVGKTVTLSTLSGVRRFQVAAVYFDYSSDRGVVAMDLPTFARHFGAQRPTGLTTYLVAGADAQRTRAELLAAIGPEHHVYIYTNASLRAEVLRIFDATFSITYALEAIAILVAILGVAGTLLTLTLERRREIAVLRLVGADRGQVRRMVVIEAGMLGLVSQAVALVVGVLLSLVLVYVVNLQSFGWTIRFHVPWGFLAQMSVVLVVSTALSGLYPARLASRLDVAGEVAEE